MRTIIHILRKEFLQIFRNKAMIPIIFLMPLVQLLVLAHAVTFEIKNISFAVVDFDKTKFSRELISKFSSNGYFILKNYYENTEEALNGFRKNKYKLIIQIPKGFEKDYIVSGKTKLQVLINAEDMSAAGIINNYSSEIIKQFNTDIMQESIFVPQTTSIPIIEINFSNWYNPELNYKTYMVPGILVILVSLIGIFLTSMNITREKELGTIEQINVTPIRKYQFVFGKLFPFWIIGMLELAFGMVTGIILFNIPLLGNPLLIFFIAAIYLVVVLSIGLFISTITNTQQQAMFIAWFFMMLFVLLGGVFTPVEYMPQWAKIIAFFNPIAHFTRVIRMIMLKGSDMKDVLQTIYILIIYGFITSTLSVWLYRKRG
ncbi:MAG: ABC transporter permease [Ignavibacteria bacterium]|nr:ABC transporter permease [Ignavibacteria bacterium]